MGLKSKGEKKWPAQSVEMRSIDDLFPYANNSRTHSQQQVDQIAASINEWGWTVPVLIDEKGMLIAGHGRIMAAQKLGIEEVPTMVAEGWTEAQKKAYVIADNKLALNADWDYEKLQVEINGLQELDFNVELLGFEDFEVHSILEGDGGWESDIDVAERDGVNLDGIQGKIVVVCEQEDRMELVDLLERAILESGIEARIE